MSSALKKPDKYILSEFERSIFKKIIDECNMAEKHLPDDWRFFNYAPEFIVSEDAKSTALEVVIETENAKKKSSFFSRLFRR